MRNSYKHVLVHYTSHCTFIKAKRPQNFMHGHSTKHIQLWSLSHKFNNFIRIVPPQILRLCQLTLPYKWNMASLLSLEIQWTGNCLNDITTWARNLFLSRKQCISNNQCHSRSHKGETGRFLMTGRNHITLYKGLYRGSRSKYI